MIIVCQYPNQQPGLLFPHLEAHVDVGSVDGGRPPQGEASVRDLIQTSVTDLPGSFVGFAVGNLRCFPWVLLVLTKKMLVHLVLLVFSNQGDQKIWFYFLYQGRTHKTHHNGSARLSKTSASWNIPNPN